MKLALKEFPNSIMEPFEITSAKTPCYNCIAWAYGDSEKWFWPDAENYFYWPDNVPRIVDIDSFIKLFETIGYTICNNSSLEKNLTKVAIYTNKFGDPTHAARQLPNGLWTSKLGNSHDIQHTLSSMDKGYYGSVSIIMSKAC